MYNFKFELGQRVKDVITGFSGVVMARTQHMTGCNQYGLTPTKLDKDGKRQEWEFFDENRLVVFGKGITLPDAKPKKKTNSRGFDGNHPPQR